MRKFKGGNQAISDFRVCDNGERTAQPPEAQNTQVWYHNKGMVILFWFEEKIILSLFPFWGNPPKRRRRLFPERAHTKR